MEQREETGDFLVPGSLPSPTRLLMFAVLLPAAVALSNQFLFEFGPSFGETGSWLYLWMALSTAVLSWCVGWYLSPAWLQWIVFAWSLALLDLLTIASGLGGGIPFPFVLISAQINLVVLWAVLAEVSWQMRLPGTAAATTIVILFAIRWQWHEFSAIVLLAAGVALFVCIGLRWKGFALRRSASKSANMTQQESLKLSQFGVKHMLLWATALAPLLVVGQTLDLFVFNDLGRRSAFPAVLLSLSFATVTLIAIWAVLGAGYWALRMASLMLVPLAVAMTLDQISAFTRPAVGVPWRWSPIYHALWHLEGQWTTWLWADATMLAALLLFVRASGYRLERKSRSAP